MSEKYVGRVRDDAGERASAHRFSGGTLAKGVAYTITQSDIVNSGGCLIVVSTVASAHDQTLPSAHLNKGATITLYKNQATINALALKTNATNQIDNGTPGQRVQNVTAEFGALTVWADPASTAAVGIWRIRGSRGTWAAAA